MPNHLPSPKDRAVVRIPMGGNLGKCWVEIWNGACIETVTDAMPYGAARSLADGFNEFIKRAMEFNAKAREGRKADNGS